MTERSELDLKSGSTGFKSFSDSKLDLKVANRFGFSPVRILNLSHHHHYRHSTFSVGVL